jgi:hypothetical protein
MSGAGPRICPRKTKDNVGIGRLPQAESGLPESP